MGQSWDWVRDIWKQKRYKTAIILFYNRLPDMTYPGGEEKFHSLFNQYQTWGFFGPMAGPTWWRELFHFLGGFVLTLPFLPWPKICMTVSVIIAVLLWLKEYFLDAEQNPDVKNIIDWFFWMLGSISISILSLFLFGPTVLK